MKELEDPDMLAKFLNDPVIVKVVTILDVANLSILELLEFGVTRQDISYASTKGVIEMDRVTVPDVNITPVEGVLVSGDMYFTKFLSGKVRLTALGIYLLDCIKGCQTEQQIIENAQSRFEQGSFSPPCHPHGPA